MTAPESTFTSLTAAAAASTPPRPNPGRRLLLICAAAMLPAFGIIPPAHAQALEDIAGRYGDVVALEDVLAVL